MHFTSIDMGKMCGHYLAMLRKTAKLAQPGRIVPRKGATMRSSVRIAGGIAASLTVLATSLIATASTAEAAPTETETRTMSHCSGFVLVQTDLDANTVTSLWVTNPSLFNPPVCQQTAVAVCDPFPVPILGDPTTLPFVEMSTTTCPAGTSLILGASLVEHT